MQRAPFTGSIAVAALVVCACGPQDGRPPTNFCQGVQCAPAGASPLTLHVTWQRNAGVSGITMANAVIETETSSRRPVTWTCDPPAERETVCRVQAAEPGTYDLDVEAPGFHSQHVREVVDPMDPEGRGHCCPNSYEAHMRDVELWRLPDPQCVAEYAGLPLDRWEEALEGRACQVEPDLAPPETLPDSSCDGLMPPEVEARSVVLPEGFYTICGDPTSDGGGTLSAPMQRDAMLSLVDAPAAFWAADGTWSRHSPNTVSGYGMYPLVVPGPSGFTAIDRGWQARVPLRYVNAFDGQGELANHVMVPWQWSHTPPVTVAPTRDGGFVAIIGTYGCEWHMYGLHAIKVAPTGDVVSGPWPIAAIAYDVFQARDPDEFERSRPSIARAVRAAIDDAGRLLVVWDGKATCGQYVIAGRWLDAETGRSLTDVFVAAPGTSGPPFRARRLLGGSIALMTGYGGWSRSFREGSPAGAAPPAWLLEHSAWDIEIVRGGRAYAALPLLDPACNPRLDVLSPAGEVCATVQYPPLRGAPVGAACDDDSLYPRGWFHVGFDGTVMRMVNDSWSCRGAGGECCEYEWWSGQLR